MDFYQFAAGAALADSTQVKKLEAVQNATSADPAEYKSRIAFVEYNEEHEEHQYGAKCHHVVQVIATRTTKKGQQWKTQKYNKSGDQEGKPRWNCADDIVLLPPNDSVVLYGDKKQKLQVHYNLGSGMATLKKTGTSYTGVFQHPHA